MNRVFGFTSSRLCRRSFAEADRLAAQRGKRRVNFFLAAASDEMRLLSSSKGRHPQRSTKAITPSAYIKKKHMIQISNTTILSIMLL